MGSLGTGTKQQPVHSVPTVEPTDSWAMCSAEEIHRTAAQGLDAAITSRHSRDIRRFSSREIPNGQAAVQCLIINRNAVHRYQVSLQFSSGRSPTDRRVKNATHPHCRLQCPFAILNACSNTDATCPACPQELDPRVCDLAIREFHETILICGQFLNTAGRLQRTPVMLIFRDICPINRQNPKGSRALTGNQGEPCSASSKDHLR